jgi:dihydroxyacid dehydratase/phosphogluconate dehydratase
MSAPLDNLLGVSADDLAGLRTSAPGPGGALPLTPQLLLDEPSGNLFGLTQNVGMGWRVSEALHPPMLILSTLGGMRTPDGAPIALGYHTGHWELDELVRIAALALAEGGALPFAAYCSDPCDGRSQGTAGMLDSLPYRNDAAIVLRRLIRSLPTRKGVLGVATCDKGLPAMMMAVAGAGDLPGIVVPGGVTLPASDGEDAGTVQTLGVRYAHGTIGLQEAAELGCRACASSGGGCQFLGTAATAQVVAEALGLALPHSALMPSGQPVGSTNLLLHIPAIAHAAGRARPTVEDWREINRRTPRLVSVLPNGPVDHPTVRVFLAGGVPEVMLHLRDLGLLELGALTAVGAPLGEVLAWWEASEGRARCRQALQRHDGIDPDEVIVPPERAARLGMASTLSFLTGNLAPEGAIVKSTAISAELMPGGRFEHEGPARVFVREADAVRAIKAGEIRAGDVMVLAGIGPAGTGMEETYQVTSALKHLPFGKHVALVTDARFSGVSTGACVGHVGPEALAGGPLGKVEEGDTIRLEIDTGRCSGRLDLVGSGGERFGPEAGAQLLDTRPLRSDLAPRPDLPDDTRLWAALQAASGGTWAGCVYDPDRIIALLTKALA